MAIKRENHLTVVFSFLLCLFQKVNYSTGQIIEHFCLKCLFLSAADFSLSSCRTPLSVFGSLVFSFILQRLTYFAPQRIISLKTGLHRSHISQRLLKDLYYSRIQCFVRKNKVPRLDLMKNY